MAIAGTGLMGAPMETLRTALSELSAVQTWMGAADAAAALARIHVHQFDDPYDDPGDETKRALGAAARPLILLSQYELSAEGAGESYWGKTGTIEIDFEEMAQNASGVETSSNAVETSDACMHLVNAVGAILEALEAAIETGGTLHAGAWSIHTQAGRIAPADRKAGLDLAGMTIHLQRADMTGVQE